MPVSYYCKKCNKTMNEQEFYASNNLEKYPEGKIDMCKKCITMHVDNLNPDTFLWILQEVDVPWVPDEWNKLLEGYVKKNKSLTSTSILGRYLAKMKLKKWKDFRWKDNEAIQQINNAKIEETMRRQGYDAVQIADAINKATFDTEIDVRRPVYDDVERDSVGLAIGYSSALPSDSPENNLSPQNNYNPSFAIDYDDLDLTEEEKTMLLLKWGKGYKHSEWVQLETLYNEMMKSYDIQTAGHIDTLKLLCKTSLKANQLIDIGDKQYYVPVKFL